MIIRSHRGLTAVPVQSLLPKESKVVVLRCWWSARLQGRESEGMKSWFKGDLGEERG